MPYMDGDCLFEVLTTNNNNFIIIQVTQCLVCVCVCLEWKKSNILAKQ